MKHDGYFYTIEGYISTLHGPYATYQEAHELAVDKADEIADLLEGGNMS